MLFRSAHALAWPERIDSGARSVDLFEMARLDFCTPDRQRFPCLDLAYEAAATGGTAPAILNAANEVAVDAFLDRRIAFTDIAQVIAGVLRDVTPGSDQTLAQILSDDARARYAAGELIERRTPRRQQRII